MKIRYHFDENVNISVANGLRHRGIDVTTARDVQLIQAPDEEHLAYALSNNRVLVTHDDDFLRLHHIGTPHAGIAFCHQKHYRIGQFVLALTNLWRNYQSSEIHGKVVFL